MIYLSLTEYRLLRHAILPDADLSRPALAAAAMVGDPTSVSRILTRLCKRALIEIERRTHRRITKVTTTFPWIPRKGYWVRNPRPQR